MSDGYLTGKQIWLDLHGFYGHWWDSAGLVPYRGEEYHERLKKCLAEYEAEFVEID